MSKPALGIVTNVGFKKEGTPGDKESLAGGKWLDLVSESLNYKPVLHKAESLTGDRQPQAELAFVSHHDGGGGVIFRPRFDHFGEVLEVIFGILDSGTYKPIVNNVELPMFTVECDKAGMNDVRLIGTKVNTAKFSSAGNQPLLIDLAILSQSGERDSGDFQAVSHTAWLAQKPFMHGNLAFDATAHAFLGGATGPQPRSIEFTVNNNLEGGDDVYANSVNRSFIPEGLFTVEGTMEIPYNTTSKAFWTALVAATKCKFTLTYSDGTNTVAFAFVVKFDGELPGIADRMPQWLTLPFHGVYDATDPLMLTATPSV